MKSLLIDDLTLSKELDTSDMAAIQGGRNKLIGTDEHYHNVGQFLPTPATPYDDFLGVDDQKSAHPGDQF